jgi:hypothetical protein
VAIVVGADKGASAWFGYRLSISIIDSPSGFLGLMKTKDKTWPSFSKV